MVNFLRLETAVPSVTMCVLCYWFLSNCTYCIHSLLCRMRVMYGCLLGFFHVRCLRVFSYSFHIPLKPITLVCISFKSKLYIVFF